MVAGVDNPHFHKGTMDQATSPDQRRFRRYSVKLPCRVKPRASHKSAELPELKVETLDVSSGGLFFLASAEWSIGTAIEFELELPAHGVRRPVRIRCRGTITRVVPQEGGSTGIGATIDHYKFSPLREGKQAVIIRAQASYCPPGLDESKEEGVLRPHCRHRPVQYLNNILELDHRAIEKRIRAKQHFRRFGCWGRTV